MSAKILRPDFPWRGGTGARRCHAGSHVAAEALRTIEAAQGEFFNELGVAMGRYCAAVETCLADLERRTARVPGKHKPPVGAA
jgi:hypothetical protein